MPDPHRARRHARRNLGSMRRCLITVAAISSLSGSSLWARSDEIPKLDVRPVCRGIANQSGEKGRELKARIEQCVTSEQEVQTQLKTAWPSFSAADKRHCGSLTRMGGESSYTELLTCLEMSRDVRALKSPGTASSQSTTDNPSASTPVRQKSPGAAAQPAPVNPSQSELQRQLERTKSDADTAKKSEEEALRKLADTEAALQREKSEAEQVKAEAEQAKADAERAKADAESAKLAQTSLESKLADAESARTALEHRTAEREPAESRLRNIVIGLSSIIGALAVAVLYLLRKLRIERRLVQVLPPESNSGEAKIETIRSED